MTATYASGEVPMIGDVVECVSVDDSDILVMGVEQVVDRIRTWTVNGFFSERFKLLRRSPASFDISSLDCVGVFEPLPAEPKFTAANSSASGPSPWNASDVEPQATADCEVTPGSEKSFGQIGYETLHGQVDGQQELTGLKWEHCFSRPRYEAAAIAIIEEYKRRHVGPELAALRKSIEGLNGWKATCAVQRQTIDGLQSHLAAVTKERDEAVEKWQLVSADYQRESKRMCDLLAESDAACAAMRGDLQWVFDQLSWRDWYYDKEDWQKRFDGMEGVCDPPLIRTTAGRDLLARLAEMEAKVAK